LTDHETSEPLDQATALANVLDECRMVLPGVQALFGFQLIAVFNSTFEEKLTNTQQKFHLVAIALAVIAIALVMAPASLHQQAEPKLASDRFLRVSRRLLLAAMAPLATSISLDVFLVAEIICHNEAVAATVAGGLFAILLSLWFLYPHFYRSHQ
jgi:hypothetical protein